jgi:hypothetical protein
MKTTIALTLLAAFALGAFGPALDAAPAVKPQTAHDRMRAAAQQMCGSENATAVEIAPGVVDCLSTGGRKLKRQP